MNLSTLQRPKPRRPLFLLRKFLGKKDVGMLAESGTEELGGKRVKEIILR